MKICRTQRAWRARKKALLKAEREKMSNEKSPGMRALEAIERGWVISTECGNRLDESRSEVAAIIERETGVTELSNALKGVSALIGKLSMQADELANALERAVHIIDCAYANDGRDPCNNDNYCDIKDALAAYRKKS